MRRAKTTQSYLRCWKIPRSSTGAAVAVLRYPTSTYRRTLLAACVRLTHAPLFQGNGRSSSGSPKVFLRNHNQRIYLFTPECVK